MTDSDKIQEEFERWKHTWDYEYSLPGQKDAFFAGYIRGQREFALKYLVEEAERNGDYEV